MSLGWNQWEARLTSYKAKGQGCGNAKPRSLQSIGMLTKSDFNRYLECPIHLWLHRHRRNSIAVEMTDMKL